MTRTALLSIAAIALGAPLAGAQSGTPPDTVRRGQQAVAAGCTPIQTPRPPTAAQRRQARDLAQRGQQAAILGDRVVARDQLRLAARLDPTDPDLAYQLARAEESTGARTEAAKEYCRFLALAPDAPDAADARARVADLVGPPSVQRSAVVPEAPAAPSSVAVARPEPKSPAQALSLGLVIPGAGQFYAGRPVRGLLTLAGVGAAVACGMRQTTADKSFQETALDPFGNPYTYTVTRQVTERPCLAPGIAAAGAIAIVSAIDAFNFTRRMNRERLSLAIVPGFRGVGLRFSVR